MNAPTTDSERVTAPAASFATVADRQAQGIDARERLPLSSVGDLDEEADRDPIGLLLEQATSRVPELVPVRHGRMALSPFTFYRGAALVMADDLSRTKNSGLTVQLCGDAHLSNFGLFATPERRLAFDVNDFDETYPGPFEWDVKRLAASLAVAALQNGFERRAAKEIARSCAREYRETIAQQSEMGTLQSWYMHAEPTRKLVNMRDMIDAATAKSIRKQIDKAWRRDSLSALTKLTTVVDGELRFVSAPPLIVPIEELWSLESSRDIYAEFGDRLTAFRATMEPRHRVLLDKFRLERVARKVVGVGSVGTQAWVLLFRGRDENDPLILQAKEAQESVLARYLDGPTFDNQGRRVVQGQQLTQAVSDVFLGWDSGRGHDGVSRDFYLRQLRDAKGSILIEGLDQGGLDAYGRACGRVLAYGHARSGDAVAIAAYLGDAEEFDKSIMRFASRYAKRNMADHAVFVDAITAAKIPAITDI
ncbi:DUF2252 domain-containing protein [Gordonia sp. NPDC003425]